MRDCGCRQRADSNQAWRGALRSALDALRERGRAAYLDVGVDVWPSVLGDPVDVRVLLGVDLGAFLWMVTEDD